MTAHARSVLLMLPLACAIAFSAFAEPSMDAVKKDLAPTGKLRAAINLGNSVLAQTGSTPGALKGITPDLAHAREMVAVEHRHIQRFGLCTLV